MGANPGAGQWALEWLPVSEAVMDPAGELHRGPFGLEELRSVFAAQPGSDVEKCAR
jgi:hypothetical protein